MVSLIEKKLRKITELESEVHVLKGNLRFTLKNFSAVVISGGYLPDFLIYNGDDKMCILACREVELLRDFLNKILEGKTEKKSLDGSIL